ncbi:MAG TPA: monooxygenase [Propionibacterium sp.]|jgi:hypothetical protein|nr:monooxygenase [Propionibacterium sp.]
MAILAQFDFPASGPWGAEMSEAYVPLAEDIAAEPKLLWKIWTENADTQMAGGIYLFEDLESAQAYAEKHTARLQSFGISDIRVLYFNVNEPLTRTTRGPVG